MPIKDAGTFLRLTEIATEFNDPAPHQMSEFYRGGSRVTDVVANANIPISGTLRFGQFYGTGNSVSVAASSGTNVDAAPLFPGSWTGTSTKTLTIASDVQIVGTNVALTVPSNMGGTLDIQNAGNIIGSRGNAGNGGTSGNGGNASAGGAAISIQANGVTLNNSGTVSGGGGGGGGGAKGASTTNSSQINIGAANYSPSRQWEQLFSGGAFQNNRGKLIIPGVATINFTGGAQNTTQLNKTSGTGTPARINRGNPLGDPVPNPKRFNVGGGFYTATTTTPGGNGGAGGNGYGWNGSSVVTAQSGSAGSNPGGASGGAGGGAGAAGTAGSNSPAFSGGSAGAGGNSITSPGAVNYSVTNTGTINGTQG